MQQTAPKFMSQVKAKFVAAPNAAQDTNMQTATS